jgi:hypothetical protein
MSPLEGSGSGLQSTSGSQKAPPPEPLVLAVVEMAVVALLPAEPVVVPLPAEPVEVLVVVGPALVALAVSDVEGPAAVLEPLPPAELALVPPAELALPLAELLVPPAAVLVPPFTSSELQPETLTTMAAARVWRIRALMLA